jgi:hypothetical protein
MRRASAARLTFLALFFTTTTAAVRSQVPSSGAATKAVKKSFLVQSVDLLFPRGIDSLSSETQRLSPKEKDRIEKEIGHLLKQLAAANKMFASDFGAAFGRSIGANIEPVFQLEQVDSPTAYVKPADSNPRVGVIHIGLPLLRMDLVLADHFSVKEASELPPAYVALIKEREGYRDLKGGTALGDIVRDVKGNGDDRWDRNMDAQERADALQQAYTGALIFVLAHEMGHIALGHLKSSTNTCFDDVRNADSARTIFGISSQRAKQELEADFYAGMLSARLFNRTDTVITQTETKFTHMTIDTGVFLDKGLRLAGFETGLSCEYPALEARKGAVLLGTDIGIMAVSNTSTQTTFHSEVAANQALDLTNFAWRADPDSFIMASSVGTSNEDLATESLYLAALSIVLDPSYDGGYFAAGRALTFLKRTDRAKEMFSKAVDLARAEDKEDFKKRSEVILSTPIDRNGYIIKKE